MEIFGPSGLTVDYIGLKLVVFCSSNSSTRGTFLTQIFLTYLFNEIFVLNMLKMC